MKHLDREIENVKKHLLSLCAIIESCVQRAVQALSTRSDRLAQQVIDRDHETDQIEVDIEEECLKILALYQPVAIDLRFVIAVLKINNDLERIGDEAVNIAERAVFLSHEPPIEVSLDYTLMADKSQNMLHRSLDALVNLDAALAYKVCAADDEVDALNRQMYIDIQNAIRKNPERVECLVHLLSVSRHLERIADYATNIAEDIVYLIDGDIIRHKSEVYRKHGEN